MTTNEKVKYWIDLSDRDFNVAEYLSKGGHNLLAGYMCHQAVEKMMKGYFTKINEDTPPFTHDLTGLAQKTGIYDVNGRTTKRFHRRPQSTQHRSTLSGL